MTFICAPRESAVRSGLSIAVAYIIGYIVGLLSKSEKSNATCVREPLALSNNGLAERYSVPTRSRSNEQHCPLERFTVKEYLPHKTTDVFNFFHEYFSSFSVMNSDAPQDFVTLPMLHIWPMYFEAYHNHLHRYRGKEVFFLEIGVQSGGKIPLLRDYFGPGLTYIGVDINPSTKMFESANFIHIEIGDTGDPLFLYDLKRKYPKIDVLLDDGGHTMSQQLLAIREMLPHLQEDGVYICEDLSTSWATAYGGQPGKDHRDETFRDTTMVGFVHKTMDWLNAGWISGKITQWNVSLPDDFWPGDEEWWIEFQKTVRHIHYYNQLVVYEKGQFSRPYNNVTVGRRIPYEPSGNHEKVIWEPILSGVSNFTKSRW